MTNQKLLNDIQQLLKQGKNKEEIRTVLLTNGWLVSVVEEALKDTSLVNPISSLSSPKGDSKFNKILLCVWLCTAVLVVIALLMYLIG